MEMTMRWFGKDYDTVTLEQIKQTRYATGIITTLYNKMPGEVWNLDEILAMKKEVEDAGLHLAGIESVNVSDAIKTGGAGRDHDIQAYIETFVSCQQECQNCSPRMTKLCILKFLLKKIQLSSFFLVFKHP